MFEPSAQSWRRSRTDVPSERHPASPSVPPRNRATGTQALPHLDPRAKTQRATLVGRHPPATLTPVMTGKLVVYSGPPNGIQAVRRALRNDEFEVVPVEPTRSAVASALGRADVFLDASMKVPLDEPLVAGAPRLSLVITATTGADHIDAQALAAKGATLMTLKGQSEILSQVTPAAEHSWLLLMACARKLRGAIRHVLEEKWDRTSFPGLMLRGRTLGVIGCGRLGQWMARYAQAFEMRVLGFDPYVTPWPEFIERAELDELLAASDFVSLHVHLSDDTKGLLNAERIARMKKGAILINTSRGALVDEGALVRALEEGRVGGVAADVVCDEPDIGRSTLWTYARDHDQCIVTPHIGGFSPDALDLVLTHTAGRIERFFGQGASS